ncbi:unnamed protein product [Sphagnum balticum]
MGALQAFILQLLPCHALKMTAQLMVWSGAALMDYGGKSGGGEKGERKACGEGWEEKEADGLEQRRVDKGA